MGKRYDWEVTPQNTPRLKERRILLLLASGLFVLNLLIIAFCHPDERGDSLICAALVISYASTFLLERRKEKWSWGYVIIVCTLCFLGSAAWIYKTGYYRYYALYVVELAAFAIVAALMFKKKASKIGGTRRVLICPVWQYKRFDTYLSSAEENGYRLIGISWFFCMHFQKAAPKQVRYFSTYHCLKDQGMNGIEDELRSKYRGNPVPVRMGMRQIHRITDSNVNLAELEELRRQAMPRILFERLFFAAVLLAGMVCVSVLIQISVLFWVALIALTMILVYYILGLLAVSKR